MRGKQRPKADRLQNVRLIPACAGKTSEARGSTSFLRAHPRVCGENTRQIERLCQAWGSSPRVRGKQGRQAQSRSSARLIPACAGKTSSPESSNGQPRAHPRVCGENRAVEPVTVAVRGSSPRVRGKQTSAAAALRSPGLIPACAGKTYGLLTVRCVIRAHPRVCGENTRLTGDIASTNGSSPRVRGKLKGAKYRVHRVRLIPACAGKTLAPYRLIDAMRAHPRVCGENLIAVWTAWTAPGSSPRVRGKRIWGSF